MKTIRLTMAQALVRFLDNQFIEVDGVQNRFVKGVFIIPSPKCISIASTIPMVSAQASPTLRSTRPVTTVWLSSTTVSTPSAPLPAMLCATHGASVIWTAIPG